MRPQRWHILALSFALLGTSGCALALVGAGVAGGYAISKDGVRNTFDRSKDDVYRESLAVANEVGLVTSEDPRKGELKVRVENTNVVIRVKRLTSHAVELKVSARNQVLMPDLDVAQNVYNRIFERIK